MKRFSSATLLLFVFLTVDAQVPFWQDQIFDANANFFEIQAAAEKYFEGKEEQRGTGWKQYKRWEWYWGQRVNPDGSFPAPGHILEELKKYKAIHGGRSTTNNTDNWQELGPVTLPNNGTNQPNGMGRINCIAFHPTDADIIYIGAPSGGVWKTTDGGGSWTLLDNGLTRLGISSIVIHPTNTDIIYIGTGDRDAGDAPGYGVWRSTNAGDTWSPHNSGMGNRTVNEILMDPTNSDILIAATNSRIYRSINGGSNWTQVFSGHTCKDIAFKPGDPDIIYATGTRFYRSSNNGQSFSQITSGLPTSGLQRMALAVSEDNSNYVYVLAGGSSGLVGFYRSVDSGLNFSLRSNTPNTLGYDPDGQDSGSQAWYDLVAVADPNDAETVYTGGINIYKSTNGGTNWSLVAHWYGGGGADDIHADQHALEFSPINDTHIFSGNDGGLYRSTDGGNNWTDFSSGLAIAQVYKLGQSATQEDLVINGYQDNGTAIYKSGVWNTEIGGDGFESIIDYTDINYMYGALYYGDIRRSTNFGINFSIIADKGTNGITESGAWVTPYKLHPTDPNTMFIGYKNVWESNNVKAASTGSVAWTKISSFSGSEDIVDLAIAPSDPDVIYVSRGGNSNFYRTINGGTNWTDLESSLPAGGTPKDIEIDPDDPEHLWIALGNNIYESTNGGANWTDISGTLPNISLNTIVLDDLAGQEALYIGQDVGVYYKDNSMSDWVAYYTTLPNVEITELEIYQNEEDCGYKISASTYGRGLWQGEPMQSTSISPFACFVINDANSEGSLCNGTVITLEDRSLNSPTSWSWSISPGTYTFENGTNSSSQNPEVKFTASDTYAITLTATNGNGSDDQVKTYTVDLLTTTVLGPGETLSTDFETDPTCTTSCGEACNISGLWENSTADDVDWTIDEGGTPSNGTGPSTDSNPGTSEGNYAYTEASTPCFFNVAIMETSGCISLPISSAFEFDYHMYGSDMGTLELEVFSNNNWTDLITPISGDQGNSWNSVNLNLDAYGGDIVKFRFTGSIGNNFRSDIALDNINLVGRGQPLAIRPVYFDGEVLPGKGNLLSWNYPADENVEFYILQRFNPETQAFDSLSLFQKNVSGFSYEWLDQQPYSGTNYYRLELLEGENGVHHSSLIELNYLDAYFQYKVYPNPFTNSLFVEIPNDRNKQVLVELLDQEGKVVHSEKRWLTKGVDRFEVQTKALPQGAYFLRLTDEGVVFVEKVVKE